MTHIDAAGALEITSATPADVPLILLLINELAEYEKLRHESVATEASIQQALFGATPPKCEGLSGNHPCKR